MYIVQSAEEQALRLWCKKFKLALECKCKCKLVVIVVVVEVKSTQLIVLIAKAEK
jgi:hypothetical protein